MNAKVIKLNIPYNYSPISKFCSEVAKLPPIFLILGEVSLLRYKTLRLDYNYNLYLI